MAAGTKEDPFAGLYRIDSVQEAGQITLQGNPFNKYLLALTNPAGQQKQDLEMLRKPQSPAPVAGPEPRQMLVYQQNGYWKCKFAAQNPQGGGGGQAPAQGGGYTGGSGVVGSDEERNRSIIMQVSVKVAADVLKGTADAHTDGILTFADVLAEGILAFAKKGGQAPPAPAPQPPAQPAAQVQPAAGGWGGAAPAQQSFAPPAGGNDDIPF